MSLNNFLGYEMNEPRFLSLLEKLIGESKYLQNSPSQGLIPREDLASDHILEFLSPFMVKNGGVLEVERVSFVEGRGNLIIKYPGTTDRICSFVGSHLDVVPANPIGWDRDPFKLIIEGDMLYGRGTTDCLGHVAMLADLMASLAEKKPVLKTSIVVVLIANEENSSFKGIGIDQLVKEGYVETLKGGPLFWVDSADSQPCVGTAGMLQWKLDVIGKLFHSGLPHKGINSIEMAMDVVSHIQSRFYKDFNRDPREIEYNFTTQSTMKPTQISCSPGSINQLPPDCTVQGDIRLSPFYDVAVVRKAIESYVAEINQAPETLHNHACRGPHSNYTLPDEGRTGAVKLSWIFEGENGIACNLKSIGFQALYEATATVLGEAKPFSIGGSLPLVRELQEQGFDVQISGYGFSSRYLNVYICNNCYMHVVIYYFDE
jgi:acetylornithine deacetylase